MLCLYEYEQPEPSLKWGPTFCGLAYLTERTVFSAHVCCVTRVRTSFSWLSNIPHHMMLPGHRCVGMLSGAVGCVGVHGPDSLPLVLLGGCPDMEFLCFTIILCFMCWEAAPVFSTAAMPFMFPLAAVCVCVCVPMCVLQVGAVSAQGCGLHPPCG